MKTEGHASGLVPFLHRQRGSRGLRRCQSAPQAPSSASGACAGRRNRAGKVEATTGFEPVNRGFADLPLNHLGTSPRRCRGRGRPARLAGPRGFEPRFTDPKSAVLPLDEGPAGCTARTRARILGGSGAEDGTRTRDPHLGKVMLYQLSHFRPLTPAVPGHRARGGLVPRARIELATPRFSVACSTN